MAEPEFVEIRIESGQPTDPYLTVHVTGSEGSNLRAAMESAGAEVSNVLEMSAPTVAQDVFSVIAIPGTLTALVAGMRVYLHRNDGKHFKTTMNGEPLEFVGLSDKQIKKIMKDRRKKWDDGWREQFPEMGERPDDD